MDRAPSGKKKKKLTTSPNPAPDPPEVSPAVPWRDLGAVFLFAFVIRALYLWQISSAPFFNLRMGDGEIYHQWAQSIAAGDWIGKGVFYQAPLYPYFLGIIYAIFGESGAIVRFIQELLSATSCAILAFAGFTLFGRRGLIAGLLLAIYPPAIFLDSLIEKSAIICLATSTLLLLLAMQTKSLSTRLSIATGITLALLALTRENALLLIIPVLLWMARQRPRFLKQAGMLLAGMAAILLPVGLRNLAAGGEFHLTTYQLGPNLYIGNHAGAPGWYQPLVEGHGNAVFERDDATRIAQENSGRPLTPSEVSRFWTNQTLHYITSQPVDWLRLMLRKFMLLFNEAEIYDTESQMVYGEWSWLLRILSPFTFGVLLAFAVMGAVVTAKDWRGMWFLHAFIAIYAISTACFYIFARYRFPIAPALILFATAACIKIIDAARSKQFKPLAPGAAIAVVAFLLSCVPLVDAHSGIATNYLAIANTLAKQPQTSDLAIDFYNRTLAQDPQWPPAHLGLGILLLQTSRPNEAIPHFQSALTVWPDYAESHYYLSMALKAIGRNEEANREYTEAMRTRMQQTR